MKSKKAKFTAIAGGTTAGVGSIGAILAAIGFCPCTYVPLFAGFGMFLLILSYLLKYNLILIIFGVGLVIASIIFHPKKTCKIHN